MNYSGCICVWVCAPKNTCPGFTQINLYLISILTVFCETISVHSEPGHITQNLPYKTAAAAAVFCH